MFSFNCNLCFSRTSVLVTFVSHIGGSNKSCARLMTDFIRFDQQRVEGDRARRTPRDVSYLPPPAKQTDIDVPPYCIHFPADRQVLIILIYKLFIFCLVCFGLFWAPSVFP